MAKESKRTDIEVELGRKMHEIGLEQEIFTASQKRLKKLQDEANKIDEQLGKLDLIKEK